MNYFDKIKKEMLDEQNRRGLRDKVIVDARALHQLLDDYERMDSILRERYDDDAYDELKHKLYNILRALYYENHDSEQLMLFIMGTLRPMIEERIKYNVIDRIFMKK